MGEGLAAPVLAGAAGRNAGMVLHRERGGRALLRPEVVAQPVETLVVHPDPADVRRRAGRAGQQLDLIRTGKVIHPLDHGPVAIQKNESSHKYPLIPAS